MNTPTPTKPDASELLAIPRDTVRFLADTLEAHWPEKREDQDWFEMQHRVLSDALDATTPVTVVGLPGREEIARIVSDKANWEEDYPPGSLGAFNAQGRKEKALEKADAILALLTPSAGESGAAQSSPGHTAAAKIDWVDCPICGEPDMRKETDVEGLSLIRCVNLRCPSNGAGETIPRSPDDGAPMGDAHHINGPFASLTKSDGSGSPVEENPDDPTASRLQQGLATSSRPSTAAPPRGKGPGAASVAKPESHPASAPHAALGPSDPHPAAHGSDASVRALSDQWRRSAADLRRSEPDAFSVDTRTAARADAFDRCADLLDAALASQPRQEPVAWTGAQIAKWHRTWSRDYFARGYEERDASRDCRMLADFSAAAPPTSGDAKEVG